MAYFFFDTTALAKRYSLELGTHKINEILNEKKSHVVLAECTVTELFSTLNKKVRRADITRDDFYTIVYKFESEMEHGLFQFIDMTPTVIKNSKLLLLQHSFLRYATALQLAYAIEIFALKPTIVASDIHFLDICKISGFKILNPEK
ncbi:MAG: type II toxin-antitoxin system VapC family toxin [Nitrospirae bacterium]|nr:type II toxin-antitoxin system VapC family toxin [Nitrospirota bacterium]MBI3351598.1 type II toxin-antitoxin system VapC family toxin [Nitrospirota bacterium]